MMGQGHCDTLGSNTQLIEVVRMTFLFHGSFALDCPRMAGLIKQVLKNPKLKNKELAEPLNYAAPSAATYGSWLHKTGLAEMGLPLKLTPMGQVVIENDPTLALATSKWFLHHELVTDPERAEAWH